MARKKKNVSTEEDIVVTNIEKETIKTEFINPPEETLSEDIKVEENNVEKIPEFKEVQKRKILKFTPVGPKIEYI